MTDQNRSDGPTSSAVMLERTLRRARQIRRRRSAGLASALVILVAFAIGVPLALAGGGSHRQQLHVVGGPPATASAPAVTPTTSAQGSPAAPPPAVAAVTSTSAAPQPCATSQLSASLTGANGTAGAIGYRLELRNTKGATCTLRGFPGVSYVTGGNGTTVGAPALRSGAAATTVTLAPGQAAEAPLLETDSLNYPPTTCQLASVDGLRIFPPDQRAALFIAQTGHACANPADNVLQVGPVQPAPG